MRTGGSTPAAGCCPTLIAGSVSTIAADGSAPTGAASPTAACARGAITGAAPLSGSAGGSGRGAGGTSIRGGGGVGGSAVCAVFGPAGALVNVTAPLIQSNSFTSTPVGSPDRVPRITDTAA